MRGSGDKSDSFPGATARVVVRSRTGSTRSEKYRATAGVVRESGDKSDSSPGATARVVVRSRTGSTRSQVGCGGPGRRPIAHWQYALPGGAWWPGSSPDRALAVRAPKWLKSGPTGRWSARWAVREAGPIRCSRSCTGCPRGWWRCRRWRRRGRPTSARC